MKKRTKIVLGGLLIILVMLNLTLPSNNDYYKWLEDEYNIKKSDQLYYYTKDDIELIDRATSHTGYGIFTTRKQNFEYIYYTKSKLSQGSGALRDLDPKEGFTIRTLEIAKMIIPMEKDNILWKVLME